MNKLKAASSLGAAFLWGSPETGEYNISVTKVLDQAALLAEFWTNDGNLGEGLIQMLPSLDGPDGFARKLHGPKKYPPNGTASSGCACSFAK